MDVLSRRGETSAEVAARHWCGVHTGLQGRTVLSGARREETVLGPRDRTRGRWPWVQQETSLGLPGGNDDARGTSHNRLIHEGEETKEDGIEGPAGPLSEIGARGALAVVAGCVGRAADRVLDGRRRTGHRGGAGERPSATKWHPGGPRGTRQPTARTAEPPEGTAERGSGSGLPDGRQGRIGPGRPPTSPTRGRPGR